MKNILIFAMALFAQSIVAQDEPTFTITEPSGIREVFAGHGEVVNFFLEENTPQFYTIHSTVPISPKDFDEGIEGLAVVTGENRYEIRVFAAKLFNGRQVAEHYARSYKGRDTVTVSISYLDGDEREVGTRANTTLTTPLRDEVHTGIPLDPSPGYREHWFYWNGKWWGSDLPLEATAKLALMWFDDGETTVAWIENLDMPEKRLSRIKELFTGEGMAWSNDRIYAIGENRVILEHGLEPEKVKARLLKAIKQSVK